MSDFSTRLSALREQKGWSKTYVAKQIGLTSMQTYANYEYGRREPDFETTKKLANLFNVSTDYLLGRDPREDNLKTADLTDDDTIFTFEGKPIPEQDLEYMKRLLRGGRK
nr:helix-turn-helix transcriptional regulator [Limosilactobacillus mucosae]